MEEGREWKKGGYHLQYHLSEGLRFHGVETVILHLLYITLNTKHTAVRTGGHLTILVKWIIVENVYRFSVPCS